MFQMGFERGTVTRVRKGLALPPATRRKYNIACIGLNPVILFIAGGAFSYLILAILVKIARIKLMYNIINVKCLLVYHYCDGRSSVFH